MTCYVTVKCNECVRWTFHIESVWQKRKVILNILKWLEKMKRNALLTVVFYKFKLQLIKFGTEIVQFVGHEHQVALPHGLRLILWSHFTWPEFLTQELNRLKWFRELGYGYCWKLMIRLMWMRVEQTNVIEIFKLIVCEKRTAERFSVAQIHF